MYLFAFILHFVCEEREDEFHIKTLFVRFIVLFSVFVLAFICVCICISIYKEDGCFAFVNSLIDEARYLKLIKKDWHIVLHHFSIRELNCEGSAAISLSSIDSRFFAIRIFNPSFFEISQSEFTNQGIFLSFSLFMLFGYVWHANIILVVYSKFAYALLPEIKYNFSLLRFVRSFICAKTKYIFPATEKKVFFLRCCICFEVSEPCSMFMCFISHRIQCTNQIGL